MAPGRETDDVREVATEVDRVADRLRSLGAPRLQRSWQPGRPSLADVAHDLSRHLAGLAEQAAALGAGRAPAERELPRLAPHAAGDQLAVLGHDLAAALEELDTDQTSTLRTDWATEAVQALRAVRHALP